MNCDEGSESQCFSNFRTRSRQSSEWDVLAVSAAQLLTAQPPFSANTENSEQDFFLSLSRREEQREAGKALWGVGAAEIQLISGDLVQGDLYRSQTKTELQSGCINNF